jgi:hypothetical protein
MSLTKIVNGVEVPLTPQEEQAVLAERAAAAISEANERTAANTLKNNIISIAAGAEGKVLTALTATEVRALMAILLYKAGGVDSANKVKPLSQWV